MQCAQRRRVRNVGARAAVRALGCPRAVVGRGRGLGEDVFFFFLFVSFVYNSIYNWRNYREKQRPRVLMAEQPGLLSQPDGMTWQK